MTSGEMLLAGLHLSSLAAGGFTAVVNGCRAAVGRTANRTDKLPPTRRECSSRAVAGFNARS
ncbi:hypothetical protein [Kitasatospora sp. NPDC091276]|uniref:hypothetical protein n=1 Tax=Kitasatospora sp. NPDC091276 TaxID=3155300 RepID=UPI00344AE87F